MLIFIDKVRNYLIILIVYLKKYLLCQILESSESYHLLANSRHLRYNFYPPCTSIKIYKVRLIKSFRLRSEQKVQSSHRFPIARSHGGVDFSDEAVKTGLTSRGPVEEQNT